MDVSDGDAEFARLSAEYDRLFKENAGREPPADDEGTFDDLLAKVGQIAEGDLDEARRLIAAAAWLGVDELERERFLKVVKTALKSGAKIDLLRKIWNDAEAKAKAALAPTAEELARALAEAERKRLDERRREADRLEPRVALIANDPALLDRMVKVVGSLGVVQEECGIVAAYLTATSRLNRRRCLSLLRRGAPASGKNWLVEQILQLMPPGSVVVVSSGSPKALIYGGAGAEDVDALKHKLVYLPEAASTLAVKNGVESDFTAMVRMLISEGRIHHHTVVSQDSGPPVGLVIVKNGPIAVIVTSARNDIEDELLTRLMLADSDESLGQTGKVVTSILDTAAGKPWTPLPGEAEIELWRDFQRWLELGGPYDVVIPYAQAVRAAFTLTPAATPGAVRIRRDISGFVAAVATSAILHKAQRQTDSEGRIVATLDDYRHAFGAFAPGMAALYRPQVSSGVIALVKALETMIEAERVRVEAEKATALAKDPNAVLPFDLAFDGTVRATHKQLKSALGISSDDAIASRIQDALTASVVECTNPEAARSVGSRYRVKINSGALKSSAGIPVFPTPDMVEAMMNDPTKLAETLATIAVESVEPEDEGLKSENVEPYYPF